MNDTFQGLQFDGLNVNEIVFGLKTKKINPREMCASTVIKKAVDVMEKFFISLIVN